ncbi:MAG: right-handed parallel beta-helix repeat-containing protein, partial [Saprospiraceae bacterium]
MKTFFLQIIFLALITNLTNAQIFVNTSAIGNNNGTSWQDAFNDLSEAIDSSNVNDEIWVAAGTYIPKNPSLWPDTIKRTFYLHQDVSLYGGFNGTETTLDQRDPATNVTILSGDVNGDDVVDDFA